MYYYMFPLSVCAILQHHIILYYLFPGQSWKPHQHKAEVPLEGFCQ